jgi:hypothetical protein
MRTICVTVSAFAAFLAALPRELAAQQSSGGAGEMIRELGRIDAGHLAIILIFGTGFVASLLWGLGAVIASLRQDVPNGERLRGEIAALEERVAALEHARAAARSDFHEPVAR